MPFEQKNSQPPSDRLPPKTDAELRQTPSGLNQHVMSAAPFGPIAVGIIGGILLGECAGWSIAVFIIALIAATVGAMFATVRQRLSVVLVATAGLGVGGTLHWSRQRVIPPRSLERLAAHDERIIRVRGKIVSEPSIRGPEAGIFAQWQFQEESTAFLLRVESIESGDEWDPATGLLRVTVKEVVLDLAEGDTLEVFGLMSPLQPPRNPGAFDWRNYYRQQGILARLYCDQRENLVRLGREPRSLAAKLRAKSRGLLTDDITAGAREEASLLEAMVLGHRSRFDRRLNDVFTRAGCVHFIAASGTNIVVLMGALWLVGRMAGLDKRRCVWLMIAAIVFYGLVAEPRPPILRACVMGLMFCAALWLQRASSSLNWICAAAIILCMIDPMWVFDIGFQLSFAAVMGVAYLAPAFWHGGAEFYWWIREVALGDQYARADQRLRSVAEKFSPVGSGMRFREFSLRTIRFVLLVFVVSAGAWLCAFPITANWFQQVQTWGVISTVLVYPLMSIVMVLSIIKMGLAAFSPTLASALTGILGVVDSFLIRIVEWLAALPAASPTVQAFPFWLTTGFYLWLLAIALTFRKTRSTIPFAGEDSFEGNTTNARNSKQWLVASTVLLALSTVAWRAEQSIAKTPRLTVTVLAVGAGTAIVAELPDNETILYDAGSLGVGGIGRNVIAPFLRHRGISRVDRLYISHPHLDHFNGIPDLAEQIPIGSIVWNECFEQFAGRFSPTKALMKHLSNLGVHVETMSSFDRSWNVGDVEFELQWPPADRCRDLSANDSSTVLQVSYLGHSILLTGDIDETAQRALIAQAGLESDVLLLPHHGSVCPSTDKFLQAVNADVLIRSSNQLTAETTNGLTALVGDTKLYNTADVGALVITIDEFGLHVESWLPNAD